MSAVCPLCGSRKGKRACPAKGAAICAACCGSKRLVEVPCPSDCVYLTGEHAASWEGRETERNRDARRLAPYVSPLSEEQRQLFLVALVGIAAVRSRHRDVTDADLGEGVAALRKTLSTQESGLIYEHAAETLRAQAVADDLRGLFRSEGEDKEDVEPDPRDLAAVWSAVAGALQASADAAEPAAFLDTTSRVASRLSGPPPGGPRPGSRIIVP